jgi:hypothetical protein
VRFEGGGADARQLAKRGQHIHHHRRLHLPHGSQQAAGMVGAMQGMVRALGQGMLCRPCR